MLSSTEHVWEFQKMHCGILFNTPYYILLLFYCFYLILTYCYIFVCCILTETLCRTPHTSSGVNLQFEADSSQARDLSLPQSPHNSFTASAEGDGVWRPLLLMVPLRLGLSSINEVYITSLKVSSLKLSTL